jgi:hypothetical protein
MQITVLAFKATSVPILQVVMRSDMNRLFIIERAPFDKVVLEDHPIEHSCDVFK